jgi:acetylornithine deacetylase/succinyl-diaminopimelate desuccinylase-like protein
MNHHVIPRADIDAVLNAGDAMAEIIREHADLLDDHGHGAVASYVRGTADGWDIARIRLDEPGGTET